MSGGLGCEGAFGHSHVQTSESDTQGGEHVQGYTQLGECSSDLCRILEVFTGEGGQAAL